MSYARAVEIVGLLDAAGVRATADPRSAQPPCVLVTPPARDYTLGCGYSADWRLMALVPGPGSADAWAALDALVDDVVDALDVERAEPTAYTLAAGGDPLPAYVLTIREAIE